MPRSNPSQNTVMQPLVVCGRTIRRVETYERFQRFIRSWANGSIPHAGAIGPPGTGKTSEYETILNGIPHHLFRGRTSALVMYTTVKDAPGWPITDHIEGCHPDRKHSLYNREEVHVLLDDDTTMTAWTYFFAHPNQIPAEQRLVCAEIDGQSIYRWPSD